MSEICQLNPGQGSMDGQSMSFNINTIINQQKDKDELKEEL